MRGLRASTDPTKGGKFGSRELMEVRRGETEIRCLNSGPPKRREYVDIGDIKRRIESNEIDLIPLVMRLG